LHSVFDDRYYYAVFADAELIAAGYAIIFLFSPPLRQPADAAAAISLPIFTLSADDVVAATLFHIEPLSPLSFRHYAARATPPFLSPPTGFQRRRHYRHDVFTVISIAPPLLPILLRAPPPFFMVFDFDRYCCLPPTSAAQQPRAAQRYAVAAGGALLLSPAAHNAATRARRERMLPRHRRDASDAARYAQPPQQHVIRKMRSYDVAAMRMRYDAGEQMAPVYRRSARAKTYKTARRRYTPLTCEYATSARSAVLFYSPARADVAHAANS
jgi:hypothetical protein